jgi:hypothetical protein
MSKSTRQLGPAGQRIFLTVLCLVFISVGLALWIPNFVLPVMDWSARKRWKEVPCTLLRSPAGQGDTLANDLSYRYEFDGGTYESADPGAGGMFAFGEEPWWKLKPGTVTVCYVNPRSPKEAVLNRSLDPDVFFWCAPLLFVVLPLLALVLGLRNIGRPPAPEPDALPPPRPGARVIAPQSRSGCSIAVQLILLLFFAGTGAIVIAIPGFRDSLPIRLFYLFPLVMGTLFILRFLVYAILTSFNPRVTLTVSPGQAAPGETVELRWDSKGGTGRVKSFRIVLEGREETCIPSGKSTKIETAPFATIEVAKGGPKDLRRGSATVTIPAPAMHSLVHGSRSIVWAFKVFGEIPHWPDVGEEYRYEVSPRKAAAP